ncbi:HtaA domain-containing protein [Kitasatospora camelliae]|uniref:HtaA domain-containing protein n=1 Tax=Kitasatospora camelliae TaxID=3156397 RepID=A0AAU8K5H5_9ACTN
MSRSTAMPAGPGNRSRTWLAAVAAATAGLGLTALGLPALAFGAGAPTAVSYDTGALDWGVKASFRGYVTGPVGQGAVELTGGATTNADGTYHFGLARARYDLGTHSLDAAFTGGVRFTAHHGALDVALSDLKLTTSGTTGTLTADTASKETVGASEVTRREDVPLVTFTVARDTTTGVPTAAKLTEQGAKAFAGFYAAGTDMDPLAVLLKQSPASPSASDSAAPSASSSPSGAGSGSPSVSASASTSASSAAPSGSPSATVSTPASASATQGSSELAVVDGRLDWGVKEGFRRYVTGPIARGKVEFGGGAADYRFGGATGSYHTGTHAVKADFTGSVRFLGHQTAGGGYELDTTFGALGVRIDRTGAYLVADVTARSRDGKTATLSAARIARLDLSRANPAPAGGVVTLSGVPATLTAEGVAAFGGYPEGEALDPVTVTLSFDRNATLPANPPINTVTSGGSGTGATDGGTAGSATLTTTGGSGMLASTGAGTPVLPLVATAAGFLLAGGGTTVLLRRRTGGRPAV